jgi:hypothetical protein
LRGSCDSMLTTAVEHSAKAIRATRCVCWSVISLFNHACSVLQAPIRSYTVSSCLAADLSYFAVYTRTLSNTSQPSYTSSEFSWLNCLLVLQNCMILTTAISYTLTGHSDTCLQPASTVCYYCCLLNYNCGELI